MNTRMVYAEGTRDIETLFRDRLPDLLGFDADPAASFLALS
jgi:hypothetical protein